jgi:NADH:ubiquinone oxidoreductase subunit E
MKETTKAVKVSRAKAGVKPTSFAFSAEEKAEIDTWATSCGLSRKEALLEAVRSAQRQGKLSNEALLAEIKSRLK